MSRHFTALRMKPSGAGKVEVELANLFDLDAGALDEVATVAWTDGFDLVIEWKAPPPQDELSAWVRAMLEQGHSMTRRPGYLAMRRRPAP